MAEPEAPRWSDRVGEPEARTGADLISIGPMLQGLRKPVNDLSWGALVEDIVFTIALTAIQAEQARMRE